MGVPGLLRYIQTKYPYSISKEIKFKTDGLYLDMNGMIHTHAQKVYGYGEGKTGNINKERKKEELEEEMFGLIINEVVELVKIFEPLRLVVAFDGPAPIAKIQQQRSRRYRNPDPIYNNYEWDSATFTPGTELMERLSIYIKKYLEKSKLAKEIIYSSHKVPGEGEHKMLDIIRNTKNGSHVVVGKDADLILLSMIASNDNKHIYVYREEDNQNLDEEKGYLVIDTQHLKENIMRDMNVKNILEFVILTFFVGNDFLRSLPELSDIKYSLPFLIKEYQYIMKNDSKFSLSLWNKSLSLYQIDWKNLKYFLDHLTAMESDIFALNENFLYVSKDETKESKIQPVNTTLLFKQSVVTVSNESFIDPNLYEIIYYRHIFGLWDSYLSSQDIPKLPIDQLCSSWLITINWNLFYYQSLSINVSHQHIFHYTPLIRSLSNYFKSLDLNLSNTWVDLSIKQVPSLYPLEALSAVLPPWSFNLLPSELQTPLLLTLPDLYPLRFTVDKLGYLMEYFPSTPDLSHSTPLSVQFDRPIHEHRIIPLLPFVSYFRLKDTFKSFTLSPQSKLLNSLETNIIYQFG